jgi:hypothetical protein
MIVLPDGREANPLGELETGHFDVCLKAGDQRDRRLAYRIQH